jgi:uncharacterized membrane protein
VILSAAPDLLLDFGVPALALLAAWRWTWVRTLGPAAICYLGGMLYANLPFASPDMPVVEAVAFGAVALSVPLLLFSVDVIAWTRLARTAVLAFALACIAVAASTLLVGTLLAGRVTHSVDLAGMLTGVYVGGTPNMAALAGAFGSPPDVFVNTNASDLILSAFYLLFMLTAGPGVIGRFMRPTPRRDAGEEALSWEVDRPATITQRGLGLGLSLACGAVGGGAYTLAPSSFAMPLSILVITTLAVLASLSRRVRTLPGTYTTGQYLLLVFCFAAGSMADLARLLAAGPGFFGFTFAVILLVVVLQFAFMAIFRIDRDTAIVTSVATIMSPPFIAAVADRLKNREMLFTGIASGLMGYAVGNYLGIAVAWMLR